MDIDYNIGHYRSEMGLSGLGNSGYLVTFVPYKYQKKSNLSHMYLQCTKLGEIDISKLSVLN